MTLNSTLGVERNTDGVSGAAGGAGNIYSGCVRNKRSLKFGTNILGNISSSDKPGFWLVHIHELQSHIPMSFYTTVAP